MIITGKVHCFFEQSGTFKNEFKKLGIFAEDYDIQNNFGQTDHLIDLFSEIENAYDCKKSIFDDITNYDLIIAFFPCIYFCAMSQVAFSFSCKNYRNLSVMEKSKKVLERSKNREKFFRIAVKMITVVLERKLRMIMENPWNEQTFLKSNFIYSPTFIDKNRQLRGDYYVKPTAYWFFNCEPTNGKSFSNSKIKKNVLLSKKATHEGICSEERSLISPDYARNFICDFILGKKQEYTSKTLFD